MMKAEDRVVFQEECLDFGFYLWSSSCALAGPEVSVLSL